MMFSRISVEAFHKKLTEGTLGNALIVDVRMPFEFKGGSVPGAINIPMKEVPLRKDEFSGYDTVYLICQSGGRSEMTGLLLGSDGVKNICNIDGGTMAWREKGYEIEMQ